MIKCPACKGKGELINPKHIKIDLKKVVRILKDNGYSIRQIALILGYKSHGSVQNLLK